METKNVIIDIRRKHGLSQEEMAAKLFVTRQAVSRWENGETTPNIETLKKISVDFLVPAAVLLDLPSEPICQSCGMDLRTVEDFGSNLDESVHTDFCKYCFQNGAFSNERTLDEMVESNLRFLDEYNAEKGLSYTPEQAKTELKQHLSKLKRWNTDN